MRSATATFEILTYWQAGSAFGGGARSDSAVHRDADGLPFLPGRTVKGLFRAASRLGESARVVPTGFTDEMFGTRAPTRGGDDREADLEAARFRTTAGALRFDSGRLPPEWLDWARGANSAHVEQLFTVVSSTRIEDGLADDKTLRADEYVVPMGLLARVSGPDDEGWVDALDHCGRLFIRNLGHRRNRGFGRVSVRVKR
ncbi:MAG: hypothetical protein HY791_29360 [Deltaproteobacteria bacterium]|nr:hypothetical protein [Deltaproteobacteria bacterium]